MIGSIGIDIIEISRIKNAIDRWGDNFLHRVYTPWEINYCQGKKYPEQSLAARFAAKEAVLKAIGTGYDKGVRWTSIEVVNDSAGKPSVRLGERIKNITGNTQIKISLSHTRKYAVACAIIINDNGN